MPNRLGWRSRQRKPTRAPEPPRQYVRVRFSPWSHKDAVYHLEGARAAPGDRVIVETSRGSAICEVVSASDQKPALYTRPCRAVPRKAGAEVSDASAD
jgi:hypothetical protein